MRGPLKHKRIAILAADGFEEVELTVPVRALRKAHARTEIVSLRRGRIGGMNLQEPSIRVGVDRTLDRAKVEDYDALFIPGGFISPDLLRQSARARDFVRAFHTAGKPIAAVCHGPWLLSSAGLLKGRVLTSWPGIRDDVVSAGATWLDQDVVRDGNLLTGRGPQDLKPFVEAMISLFAQATPLQHTGHVAVASSPPRSEPPKPVTRSLSWIPRWLFRTLLLAALVTGIVEASRRETLVRVTK